jgi:KaiC/GvpD/RAD55 family RecA-like ATPase
LIILKHESLENYLNLSRDNRLLWKPLPKSQSQEFLLNKASEQERKYDWLGAIKYYKKASKVAFNEKNFLIATETLESIGYCFFRAALQAETNEQFRNRMTLSLKSYNQMLNPLQKLGEDAKINHAKAMIAYTSSWLEPDFAKMAALLDGWWTFENKALSIYEKKTDLLAIGRTCNNLLEYSVDRRIFFKAEEYRERQRELISIGEKAIRTLSKTHDNYELCRAYCWTAWYYGLRRTVKGEPKELKKMSLLYSEKALSLSEELGDAWLIGWSHNAKFIGALFHGIEYASVLDHTKNLVKQGEIAKDNYMITIGRWASSLIVSLSVMLEEDPDKQRKILRESIQWAQEAMSRSQTISFPIGILLSQNTYTHNVDLLASIETSLKEKRILVSKAVEVGRKSFEYASRAYAQDQVWTHIRYPMDALSTALFWLSKTETGIEEKRQLLNEALKFRKEEIAFLRHLNPTFKIPHALYSLALIQTEIADTEKTKKERIRLLNKAIVSFEKCLKAAETRSLLLPTRALRDRKMGLCYHAIGKLLTQIYSLTREKERLSKALLVYNKATEHFKKAELPTCEAESIWKAAALHDRLGDFLEAADSYELVANEYVNAAKKMPHLKSLYKNYSFYMQAWSQIEQAKQSHFREDYANAATHYEKAAKFHEMSEPWSYLAANYFAWAQVESSEDISRKENPLEAIKSFQKAYEDFGTAKESIRTNISEIQAAEEKELANKLIKASDLRRHYCKIRINLEKAKIFDRKGDYNLSAKSYSRTVEDLDKIISELESEEEQRELRLIRILSQAWEKMALAEEHSSAEFYLEASQFFEQAKTYSPTKKTTQLILANSSFCKGLAAGAKYQISLEATDHAKAKRYIKNAATSYLQAGFKSASEYAKATQRLFDAYVFMNQAESEVDQEKRAKQYQMAEKLLQISAGSFIKAKQPEKTAQVQKILENVKEEKELAVSLNEVLHAPALASTTQSFATPIPTREASVGLERFEHVNIQANLIAGVKEVKIGESFCLSLEFVNAGRESALLTRVEELIPLDFVVVKKPKIYRLEDTCLNMKGKQLAPLKIVETKLILQSSKKGLYTLKPRVHYLDELGHNKSFQLKSLEIKVKEVILANRLLTGTAELDSILLGGIPKDYAIALAGPPSDERNYILKNFLETGTKENQITFYVTIEAAGIENLLKNHNFYLFLCNPKPKIQLQDLPNITKLRSKTDLTNLNIALAKAYRYLNHNLEGPKRLCIEIVSDVLLHYKADTTRKWIAEILTDFTSKGFTTLAILDPSMHPADQANAILNLFDGEISITQTDDPLECKKHIRVKKLRGQDYIKNPICLTKQA